MPNGVRVAPNNLIPRAWARKAIWCEAGDHLFGGDLLVGLGVAVAQIVGAEHDDRMGHAGLRQHVAIEPPQPAVAAQIVQDPVAAEPLVHHPERPAALPGDQPPGQLVGPAAIGVMGRDIGVGQRVAERDHASGLVRRQHVDAADEEPFVGDLADRHRDGGGKIARRRDVIGLPRIAPGDLEAGRDLAGQIERDRQVGQRLHVELDRVADYERARRDRRRTGAAKGELALRARHDRRALVPDPDIGGADRELAVAIGVRHPHPHGVAADTDARIHPQGVIVEAHTGFTRRRRGGPGADPMPVVVHRLSPPVAQLACVMTAGRTRPLGQHAPDTP